FIKQLPSDRPTEVAVKSYKDINKIIIPFFQKHKLIGKKRKDFELFCEASKLFNNKQHLTKEGIHRLRSIQSKMNLRRKLK
ncbi:LAGLIDADG family homing endonuclease, partial [Patescibacteria group bacterium]